MRTGSVALVSLALDAIQHRRLVPKSASEADGGGGTAVVYATRDPAWVLKVPRFDGRLRGTSIATVRKLWKYEATVAKKFLKLPSIARVEYVELPDGTPTLLVERGQPVPNGGITPRDAKAYMALERDFEAVDRAKWNLHDLPLILRRPDGSLFTADFGSWQKRTREADGLRFDATLRRFEVASDVGDLLDGTMGWLMEPYAESSLTLSAVIAREGRLPIGYIERRVKFGLPVPKL